MKKLMWIVAMLNLAITVAVLQFMPDLVPVHYDLAGNIDRWGSKFENLILPAVVFALSWFWQVLIRYYEKKADGSSDHEEQEKARTNARILGIAGVLMAVMFTVMQGYFLFHAYAIASLNGAGKGFDIAKVPYCLIGIMMIVLGYLMPKTSMNSYMGVRVKWSMYNDVTWSKSNRFGGYMIMIAGVLIIISSLMTSPVYSTFLLMGWLILSMLITVFYSYKVYQDELSRTYHKK